MAQPETSEQRTRRLAKSAAWALGCALLFVGCNVYDSSLLDSSALANNGGADGGSSPALGGGAPDSSSGNNSTAGGAGSVAGGSIGAAGMDSAGDSSGGAGTTIGGGSSAGSGGVAVAGAGGGTAGAAMGGSATGGATSTTLSLIDDMETIDANIPAIDGRQGFWSVANDGPASGKQTPSPVVTMSMIPAGRGT
ncbi:MAG TPA: hypothetical protein VHW01_26125, partial [Polyangiaceae bacterium]|nr:hypothetical protein [Polyangiaceae bacterium]